MCEYCKQSHINSNQAQEARERLSTYVQLAVFATRDKNSKKAEEAMEAGKRELETIVALEVNAREIRQKSLEAHGETIGMGPKSLADIFGGMQ